MAAAGFEINQPKIMRVAPGGWGVTRLTTGGDTNSEA